MTTTPQPSSRPAGRSFVLLVLVVLAGILAMHGATANGVPQSHTGAGQHASAPHQAADAAASDDCRHTSDDPNHLDHADGTCAAAGVGSPYTPPSLSAGFTEADAPSGLPASVPGAADSLAPPDLSELQLLRI